MHTLRFFPSVSLGYGGKFFGWPVPGLVKAVRAGGVSVIGRRFRWDRRRSRPATWFPARSRAGARWGTAYPSGGRGFSGASGRSAPLPRLPGGGPHFSREMGRKRAGALPLDPGFLWPLVATRWFLGPLSLVRSRGYFLRYAKTDLGRIFEKKYAEKAFCEKQSPNQGTYMGTVIAH